MVAKGGGGRNGRDTWSNDGIVGIDRSTTATRPPSPICFTQHLHSPHTSLLDAACRRKDTKGGTSVVLPERGDSFGGGKVEGGGQQEMRYTEIVVRPSLAPFLTLCILSSPLLSHCFFNVLTDHNCVLETPERGARAISDQCLSCCLEGD